MMFKKGSFEVGGVIYPTAIKYDVRLGDAFWNSSLQSYFLYQVMLMTSWATVAEVYYLPPTTKKVSCQVCVRKRQMTRNVLTLLKKALKFRRNRAGNSRALPNC